MKKKVKVRIQDRWFLVELEETSENVYTAVVEGEEFVLNYMDSITFGKPIAGAESDDESVSQKLEGEEVSSSVKHLKSPMPGTIQELLVSVGDSFKKGDQICLLESMKMQQVIRAESDGTVEDIKISVGESILDGSVILNYV